MKENGENWNKQLQTVIVEVAGLGEIFALDSLNFLVLLTKLEGLNKLEEVEFDLCRKTIFETISLLQKVKYEFK